MSEYNAARKIIAHHCPGGIKCGCCTDYAPAKQKRIDRRKTRRALKMDTKREIGE